MTKVCRDKQLERMDVLMQAACVFQNWMGTEDDAQAVNLLTQMQEMAIIAGSVLEQDQNDFRSMTVRLEEVCEVIYQMCISLQNGYKIRQYEKELQKILSSLRCDLEKIEPRKEIVFLPYQASMWDSLESVWMAAREDPNVDDYVVPIPFFDVLPDGGLGELHYQGGEYDNKIPITFYENYYLEERHPDIIFIHNPYDECNMVTRVPEQYYASQLKKCTAQLVYIPYFISPEGGPSDHQCYMPGVIFADKVIVQPDSIYETYCRVYTKIRKENKWEQILAPAEKKFLPLGSPKVDKLWNTSCEMKDLPESWQKVILKPDGSRKKIVLYNLTISGILNNNEQELKKVKNVLKLFKEKRDQAVLLWRPHPLLLTTLNSMRGQLKDEYLLLVNQFKEEGWGIFDETPDANLAMVLSDVYYGDWSSLVVSYLMTGKPVLTHDVYGSEERDFLDKVITCGYAQNIRKETGVNKIGNCVYRAIYDCVFID